MGSEGVTNMPCERRWDKETFDAAKGDNEQHQAALRPDAKAQPSTERVSMAQQARALLEGREKWEGKSGRSEERFWEDVGDAVEVEKDVQLPKD
jgi:large subunit ribosomal protein L23